MVNLNMNTTQDKIKQTCDNMKAFLIEKNKKYGNSVINPVDVFLHLITTDTSSAESSILIRCNDKINRILNSSELRENDFIDLTGYFIILLSQRNIDFTKYLE